MERGLGLCDWLRNMVRDLRIAGGSAEKKRQKSICLSRGHELPPILGGNSKLNIHFDGNILKDFPSKRCIGLGCIMTLVESELVEQNTPKT